MKSILRIALVAAAFSAKCFAFQPYINFWCEQASDGSWGINSYETTPTGPFGLLMNTQPVQTGLSGKACTYLEKYGFSEGKDYSLSNPVVQQVLNQHARSGSGAANAAQPTGSVSQMDTFPWTVPLPFVAPVQIPRSATSGSCNASIKFYSVEHDSGTVSVIDACPFTSPVTLNPCGEPLEQALTPDGTTLMVTCYDSKVVWIDTASDKVTFTLNVQAFPAGIAISPDGKKAYVTNYYDFAPSPSLLVIDVVNHTLLQTIPLLTAFPGVVTLTPDGSQAWINYYANSLVDIIDTQTGTLAGRLDFQADTENGIAFNSTGTRAFIAVGGANQLGVVDTATLKILAKIPVCDQPASVLFNPDAQTVLVASSTQRAVSVVDAVANTLVTTQTLGGGGIGGVLLLGNLPFSQ